jgi:hypothetical protein
VSAVIEPSTGSSRLLIAGSGGHVYTHDLITNKIAKQVSGGYCVLLLSHILPQCCFASGGVQTACKTSTSWQTAVCHLGVVLIAAYLSLVHTSFAHAALPIMLWDIT